MAKIRVSKKFFLLAVLGLVAAACSSSEDRPQLRVDLLLGTGVSAPQTVHISASQGAGVVKTFEVPWGTATNSKQVRLIFPSSIIGPVTIAAVATTNNSPVAQGQIPEAVTLAKGETAGPFTLVLNSVVNPTDEDGGIKDSGADQGTTETGPTGAEVGDGASPTPSDAGADAGVTDAALDSAAGDTINLSDVPNGGQDAMDAPSGLSDAPAIDAPDGAVNLPDATGAGDVPLAWEPATNVQKDDKYCYGVAVAVDPINEHVYAAWVDTTTIKVRRWNHQTAAWEKTITLENRGSPNTPGIGVDVKGTVTALWPVDSQGTSTSLDGVWTSQSKDGASWSPPVRIGAGYSADLKLVVARNGTAHAAYSKRITGGYALYTAYYDGTTWTEIAKPVEPQANYSDFAPQIGLSDLGDGLLMYGKYDQGWGFAGTVLTGTTFSEPLMLDPNNGTARGYTPALAVNRKGEGVAVWTEYTGGNTVLLARSYSPATKWSSPTPPIVAEESIGTPAVALDEQGTITLVWQQDIASGGYNLVGKRGKLDGTWSDVAILENDNRAGSSGTQYNEADPKMAVDANGNVLLVWLKDLSEGKTATIGVYGSRYAAGTWSPQTQVAQKTGLTVPYLDVAVADSGLGAVMFKYIDRSETTTDPDSYNGTVALFR